MRIWLKALITLACVTMAGFIADQFLRHEGIPRKDLLLLSDFLVGLVASLLVLVLSAHQQHKARIMAERLHVIAEMNHHIRNALQVIAYHAWSAKNEQEISSMHEALNRIAWALQEVLPQLPGGKVRPAPKGNTDRLMPSDEKHRTSA